MRDRALLINLSMLLPQPTGIAVYATHLIPHLRKLDPTLLTAQPQGDFNTHPTPANLTPDYGSRGHLRRLIWTQWQVPRLYQELQANLFFSPVPEAPLGGKCRTVVMAHDLIPLRFPRWQSPLTQYFRWYVPQVLQQAEHILCNSYATAQDLVDLYGLPAEKITPIPLAYDATQFNEHPNEHPSPAQPYFLYVGRPDPYKNLHRLITAFRDFQGEEELWIAGSDDPRYTPKLQQQVQELGITSRVKFLGYVPGESLPALLRGATALVFPSLWEGFGLPVLEAMACGTPVITSNLSSLPEVAGEAGLLVNPYQTQAITEAMAIVAGDGQARSRLRDLGLKRAQQFSWEKTGQATVEVLQRYL